MKHYVLGLLFSLVGMTGCGSGSNKETVKTSTAETPAVSEKLSENDTIIVDVRTVEEWNEGHAPCSVNIPLDQIQSKIEVLKSHKKIILVCRSGNRSEKAKKQLEEAGINNIENLGSWQNIKCP